MSELLPVPAPSPEPDWLQEARRRADKVGNHTLPSQGATHDRRLLLRALDEATARATKAESRAADWVSVEVDLPKIGLIHPKTGHRISEVVLVAQQGITHVSPHYLREDGRWFAWGASFASSDITHWFPYPKDPKESPAPLPSSPAAAPNGNPDVQRKIQHNPNIPPETMARAQAAVQAVMARQQPVEELALARPPEPKSYCENCGRNSLDTCPNGCLFGTGGTCPSCGKYLSYKPISAAVELEDSSQLPFNPGFTPKCHGCGLEANAKRCKTPECPAKTFFEAAATTTGEGKADG